MHAGKSWRWRRAAAGRRHNSCHAGPDPASTIRDPLCRHGLPVKPAMTHPRNAVLRMRSRTAGKRDDADLQARTNPAQVARLAASELGHSSVVGLEKSGGHLALRNPDQPLLPAVRQGRELGRNRVQVDAVAAVVGTALAQLDLQIEDPARIGGCGVAVGIYGHGHVGRDRGHLRQPSTDKLPTTTYSRCPQRARAASSRWKSDSRFTRQRQGRLP